MEQVHYSTGEFAKLIGKSVKTIQNWDRDGKIVAGRTSTNRRIYTQEHVDQYLNQMRQKSIAGTSNKPVVHHAFEHYAFALGANRSLFANDVILDIHITHSYHADVGGVIFTIQFIGKENCSDHTTLHLDPFLPLVNQMDVLYEYAYAEQDGDALYHQLKSAYDDGKDNAPVEIPKKLHAEYKKAFTKVSERFDIL